MDYNRFKRIFHKRVEPIALFPLLGLSTLYLYLNGEAIFGHEFAQYKELILAYIISFAIIYISLLMRGDRYQLAKWSKDLREITLLESLPAIVAGVAITGILLFMAFMALGGGPTRSYGTMWAYLPFVIVAATTEEFIFRFVMHRAAPIKFKTPKHQKTFAIAVASFTFGMFHFGVAVVMFGLSVQAIGMILSAMMMGGLWSLAVEAKTKLKRGKIAMFFGMGFAIGSHITWNVMVTYYGSTLSVLPFIYVMSIPAVLLIPIVILLRRWKK